MSIETIVRCERCKARCKVDPLPGSKAKMLRHSKGKGLCVNCATHDWLRNTYPINMQLAEYGPKALLYPHTRELFADVMRVGCADAKPEEINWTLINENWDLPFADKVKPRSDNPITQKELDEIKAGKYKAIDTPALFKHSNENSRRKIMKKKTRTSVEQMPLIEVGPENLEAIVKEVRIYKKHQFNRLSSLKKEVEQQKKIKTMVKEAGLQRLPDGTIKFEADNSIICLAPQDELITIKEKTTKKSKKSMKKKVEGEEQKNEKP